MANLPPHEASIRKNAADAWPLCPSAKPGMTDCVAFGVIGGTVEEPRLLHLAEPQPVSEDLLALAEPLDPGAVFRFAAPCAGHKCKHFDGLDCRLATRIVRMMPAVVDVLPPCRVRPRCRWWRQEGKAACERCPQIVTEITSPTEQERWMADPDSPLFLE